MEDEGLAADHQVHLCVFAEESDLSRQYEREKAQRAADHREPGLRCRRSRCCPREGRFLSELDQ